MSDIPVELVWDILTRLPVESLLRFRSACKTWCQIIDEPAFTKSHLHIQKDKHHHLILKAQTTFCMLPLTSLNNPSHVTQTLKTIKLPLSLHDVTFCNGLILLICDYKYFDMALWNPSTRERLELPRLETAAFGFMDWQTAMIRYSRGLGYDEANDDYKVIVIKSANFAKDSRREARTFVYSLNSRNWSMISEEDDYAKLHLPFDSGVFVKGELHWIAKPSNDEQHIILSLDLSTNTYRLVSLPSDFHRQNDGFLPRLCVLDRCLFLISDSERDNNLEGHKMESSGSWSKVFSFAGVGIWTFSLSPIAYLESEQQVLFEHFNWTSMKIDKFIWFDVIHGKAEKTFTTSDGGLPTNIYTARVIRPSLVRLNR